LDTPHKVIVATGQLCGQLALLGKHKINHTLQIYIVSPHAMVF